MTEFAFRIVFNVASPAGSKALQGHLDNVMTELDRLGVVEPSIGAEISTGVVEIELVAASDDFTTALQDALVDIRTAVHAAGGITHDFVGGIIVEAPALVLVSEPVGEWEQSGLTTELVSA